jgi:hypothetical protein
MPNVTSPLVVVSYSADQIRLLVSPQRMAPYLRQCDGNSDRALRLYEWSSRMSAAAFETVGHFEVLLRNAIDRALSDHFAERDRGIPWFLLHPPMSEETSATIAAARDRLRPIGHDSRHQIIAGLSFGFWSGMLGSRYEDLWRSALRHAFPYSPGNRKAVSAPVEAIRKFRNRLAHGDSMLNIDIPFELRRILDVTGYIDPQAKAWLETINRSSHVYAERPHSPIDTVVVPAREAWPFYQSSYAYVCQPGRWFQPVDRMAFYADQEVKADIPRITERRDNVPWTAQEAARLAASSNRTDRKIGAVITASRAVIGPDGSPVWPDGSYQVFLLTRPGDPEHRALPQVLPHPGRGRGSAFVQRQRYLSLHALQTAATTADLDKP